MYLERLELPKIVNSSLTPADEAINAGLEFWEWTRIQFRYGESELIDLTHADLHQHAVDTIMIHVSDRKEAEVVADITYILSTYPEDIDVFNDALYLASRNPDIRPHDLPDEMYEKCDGVDVLLHFAKWVVSKSDEG